MEKYLKLYRCTFDLMKTNAQRFVFAYIEQFSRKEGQECGASQDGISIFLHIGCATVKRCIYELQRLGIITIKRSGQRKERNSYTVNRTMLNDLRRKWNIKNDKSDHKLPEVLRVPNSIISAFGCSTQCLLISNLRQIQTAGENKGGLMSDGTHYSQDELARQCGRKLSSIKEAIADLENRGILQSFPSNLKWEKSRRCYTIDKSYIAGNDTCDIAGNDTCEGNFQQQEKTKSAIPDKKTVENQSVGDSIAGNDTCEQPEMIRVNRFLQPEMIRNEYISFSMNTSDENSAGEPTAAAGDDLTGGQSTTEEKKRAFLAALDAIPD